MKTFKKNSLLVVVSIFFIMNSKAGSNISVDDFASDNYYELLGVSHDATTSDISSACKGKAKSFHPDKHPGEEAKYNEIMSVINNACSILKDDEQRTLYNVARKIVTNNKSSIKVEDSSIRDAVLGSVCGLTPLEIKKFKNQKDMDPKTFEKEKKNYGKKVVDFLNGKVLSFIKTYGDYVDMGINVLETTLKKTIKSLKNEESKDYKIFNVVMTMARSEILLCKRLGDYQKELTEESNKKGSDKDKDKLDELKDSIAKTKLDMTETALSLLDII